MSACSALWAADQAEEARRWLPRDDYQLWSDYQYSFSIAKGVEASLTGTFKLGSDVTRPVNERVGGSLSFRAGRHLTVSPGYAYIAFQPLPGRDTRENRIYVDVNYQYALGNFLLSDRSRIERRFQPMIEYSRYRNRFQVEHPLEVGRLGLRAWISDEVFYDGLLGTWSRNRLAAGVTRKMSRILSMDFYYCRQNDHYSRPGDIHAVGVGVKFRS